MISEGPIILFDGVCNLCNSAVQFVIRHDPAAKFRFASLQSIPGRQLMEQYTLSTTGLNSFILLQDGKVFTRSSAALSVAKQLKGPIKLLYGFIIVPAFIRNAVYDLIARNRYKWFGKKDECMLPSPGIVSRFLN